MIKPFINKAFLELLNPNDENFKLIDKNSLKMQFFIGNDDIIKSANHIQDKKVKRKDKIIKRTNYFIIFLIALIFN